MSAHGVHLQWLLTFRKGSASLNMLVHIFYMIRKLSSLWVHRSVACAFDHHHSASSSWWRERAHMEDIESIRSYWEAASWKWRTHIALLQNPQHPLHALMCPSSPKSDLAIWKYFMKAHFEEKHNKLLAKHVDLWNILDFEQAEMKRIWVKWGQKMAKHTTKSKWPPLVVSEKHRAQIPSRCRHFYSTW